MGEWIRSIPAYWRPLRYELSARVGDADTNETLNREISPLYHVPSMRPGAKVGGRGACSPPPLSAPLPLARPSRPRRRERGSRVEKDRGLSANSDGCGTGAHPSAAALICDSSPPPRQYCHTQAPLPHTGGRPTAPQRPRRAATHNPPPLRPPARRAAQLLLAGGGNDPRVPRSSSDRMFREAKAHGLDATYVVYYDEGHGLARPPNRLDFYARAEEFLAAALGGRVDPLLAVSGDRDGTTARVVA